MKVIDTQRSRADDLLFLGGFAGLLICIAVLLLVWIGNDQVINAVLSFFEG